MDDLSINDLCAMADDDGLQSVLQPDQHSQGSDPAAFQAKQANLIKELRSRVQTPPLGEFCMQDLLWTDLVTNGKGKYRISKVAMILWDRLADFIQGEQHANNPALLVRFVTAVSFRLLSSYLWNSKSVVGFTTIISV
jgi:hypothetical protein